MSGRTGVFGVLSPEFKQMEDAPPLTYGLALGIAGVVLAAMLASLDQRLSTAAMADILGGLRLGQDEGSWVNTAYNIGNMAVVPMTPWLAQLISPRRLVAAEIMLFVVAAAAVPLAGNFHAIIALRFVQGFGEGGLVPLMLLTLLRFTPPQHRPEGFAVYAVVSTLVPLLSDSLAGVATDLFTWQSLFWFSAALGPVALLLVLAFLPVEEPKWEKFIDTDYFGLGCLVTFCCMLVTALSQGQRLDWFDNRLIVALFAGAFVFLAGFLVSEATARHPLLDLSLFRRRNFALGLLLVVAFNISLLGATFVEPQTQTIERALRPIQIGELLLLLAIPQLVMAPVAAALMRVLDGRLLVGAGLAAGALGSYLCTYITSVWSGGDFLFALLLQASFWPITFTPLVYLTTSVLQPQDALTGGTIFNIVRTLAISAGPAIVNAIITVRERVHSNLLLQHVVPGLPAVDERLQQIGAQGLALAARGQAYVLAYSDAFGFISLVSLAGVGLVLLQSEAPVLTTAEK